jgi:hypothetical protein
MTGGACADSTNRPCETYLRLLLLLLLLLVL